MIPGLRIASAASVLFGRRALAPLIRRERPDLVYARNLMWLAGQPGALPFIAEAHVPPANRIYQLLEGHLFARVGFRRLVVVSAKLGDIYATIFPSIAGKIVVAHDAADDPKPKKRRASAGFHVGYVGHLYFGRGGELLKAVAGGASGDHVPYRRRYTSRLHPVQVVGADAKRPNLRASAPWAACRVLSNLRCGSCALSAPGLYHRR